MRNYWNWHYLIIALLTGVIIYLIYGVQNNLKEEQRRLEVAVSSLEGQILDYRNRVARMKLEIKSKEKTADSLKNRLQETSEDLKKKQKKLSYYASEFKKLNVRDRDSVLREYLRTNQ